MYYLEKPLKKLTRTNTQKCYRRKGILKETFMQPTGMKPGRGGAGGGGAQKTNTERTKGKTQTSVLTYQ